ncbi:MAG TPA: hypothetical protein VF773_20940 [Verrucomicrobiae bacterium]
MSPLVNAPSSDRLSKAAIATGAPLGVGYGMRARALLWVCLGLNVLLAIVVVLLWRKPVPTTAVAEETLQAGAIDAKTGRPHVVVRRRGFNWSEVESPDFATYIKNLRDVGCPEKTIRDIILAEVNEMFADRMAREIQLPEQKWWLPDPDMDALQAGMDQVRTLETEKAQLLTQLLGPGWETHKSTAGANAIRFDGPVLSALSPETKTAVERIEANARQSREAIERPGEVVNGDVLVQDLARLRQETRRELAAVLNPQQLEEYLLRYSQTADQLREQLRGFGADADEFRRIFRVRDSYDQQIAALSTNDTASAARRRELERTRDAAIRESIGQERFAFYSATENPLFRQAQEQVETTGAPPEKVLPVLRVKQAVADEIARIQADQTLSEDQRRVALAGLQQQQSNSIARILSNQPADEVVPPDPNAELAQRQIQAPPPLPPYPGAPGSIQPSREGLPVGADLPPGVSQSSRGPGYRGRIGQTQEIPAAANPKGPAYPPRRR